MNVRVTPEERIRFLLSEASVLRGSPLSLRLCEHLCKDAPSRPHIDLNAVVRIAVKQLGRSIIPS